MIDSIINYIQYFFLEYIGLALAMLGLYLVYSKAFLKNQKKYIFYIGYFLLILGTGMFIYRLIFV